MISSDFNVLLSKIKSCIDGKTPKFVLSGCHYVFHGVGNGISFVFTGNNIDIQTFTLANLIEDDLGSRYTKSSNLTQGYYILTVRQKSLVTKILKDRIDAFNNR